MANYYNEIDLFAAEWLRNLIKKGLIPDGEIDTRSISDVAPNDLAGFTQCHFFAGIAGWSHALRLAGWPDDRPIWTGSCPCQPFSVAGKGKGTADERHLWPVFFNLIRECRPPVVMGEQVSGKAGYGWLDGVRFDLEAEDYACRGVDIPACAVDAPHIRQRLYWVAVGNAMRSGLEVRQVAENKRRDIREERTPAAKTGGRNISDMADASRLAQREPHDDMRAVARQDAWASSSGSSERHSAWADAVWLTGADGKARRAQPGICLLADGVPNRASKLRAYGNAIVPPLAAEVIKAFMDV
jgi:DNA (cytosine-5)-methyltransferase 1